MDREQWQNQQKKLATTTKELWIVAYRELRINGGYPAICPKFNHSQFGRALAIAIMPMYNTADKVRQRRLRKLADIKRWSQCQ
jgi:hypothetical protein